MRLIDADALLRELKEHYNKADGKKIYHPSMELAMHDVKSAPTIDAVPVVRCGECGWREDELCGHPKNDVVERVPEIGKYYRIAVHQKVDKNHFCSYGERREDDAATVVHARWEINLDGYYPYCSNCKAEPKSGKMTPACPNCGAKMDLEADDNG